MLKVHVKVHIEPKIEQATCENLVSQYNPIDEVAKRLGIKRGILNKIIGGSLFCEVGSPAK